MKTKQRFAVVADFPDYSRERQQLYRYEWHKQPNRFRALGLLVTCGLCLGMGTFGSIGLMWFLTKPVKVIHPPKLDNQPVVPKPKRERWMPPQYMEGIR